MANNEFQELTRNNEKSQFELAGKLNEFTIDSPKTQQEFLNSGKDSSITKLSADDFLNDTNTSPKTAEQGKDVKVANDSDTAQEGEKAPLPSNDLLPPVDKGADTSPETPEQGLKDQPASDTDTAQEGEQAPLPSGDALPQNPDNGTSTSPEGAASAEQSLPPSDIDTAQESPSSQPVDPAPEFPLPGANTVQEGVSDSGKSNL